MEKTLDNWTLEELRSLSHRHPGVDKEFEVIIIVPMDYAHDSGYRCMKFVITNRAMDEIIGVVGGSCDVVALNGIGGYGRHFNTDRIGHMSDWSIDCIDTSGCLRLFGPKMVLKSEIICSTFDIYDTNT